MNLEQLNKFLTTFMLNIELTWRLISDFRIPLLTKIVFIAALSIYLVVPIDLIPDFFPILGQVDDLILFILFMMQFINSCPIEIVEAHKQSILNGEWKLKFLKYLLGCSK